MSAPGLAPVSCSRPPMPERRNSSNTRVRFVAMARSGILTHDPKFDDPTITAALKGRPRYIGAIGSKKTHRERVARLTEAGVNPAELARVHAPIGLDLGAQTAEETALAILSQMVAVRHGKMGGPMASTTPAAAA